MQYIAHVCSDRVFQQDGQLNTALGPAEPRYQKEPNQQRTTAVNTASYKCVNQGESGLVGKRARNRLKLAQLIVALLCNKIYMRRESELRIKHDTVIVIHKLSPHVITATVTCFGIWPKLLMKPMVAVRFSGSSMA